MKKKLIHTLFLFVIFAISSFESENKTAVTSDNEAIGWTIMFNGELKGHVKEEYNRLLNSIKTSREGKTPLLKDGIARIEGRPNFPYLDDQCLIWDSDKDPTGILLRRTRALLEHLKKIGGIEALKALDKELKSLGNRVEATPVGASEREAMFAELYKLRHRIAMMNPLLDFNEIIFMAAGSGLGLPEVKGINHKFRGSYWQYHGFQSLPVKGEGPVVVSDWKSAEPKIRYLLPEARRKDLRFHSAFDLSFDGKEILFSAQTSCDKKVPWNLNKTRPYDLGDGPTHVYRMKLDGSFPDRLTSKGYNNGFPAWLPNGRIMYVSDYTETKSELGWNRKADRCGGWAVTLWSMKADGTDAFPVSFHETAEYHPVVDYDGKIVYSRWDYLDRNWDAAHHLWTCYPDGRDPRAPHGNYPYPHHRLPDGPSNPAEKDGRGMRPWSEMNIRPVPGSPGKYVGLAGAHHAVLPGVPIMIDTNIEDDNMMSQVLIITGSDLPHESNRDYRPFDFAGGLGYYSPWPLSEDYYLVSRFNDILLLDKFGNEILLTKWGDPEKRGYPVAARPFRPRTVPPVIPTQTWQGERREKENHKRATIFVLDVFDSRDEWSKNTEIKSLRIIQYVARPFDPGPDAWHVMKRTILGTVPVEADGSAYFEAPVERLIYFQALDKDGLAVQSMRSGTYVHPGEQMSCIGCHESRGKTPSSTKPALAIKRKPSPITPEYSGSNPICFKELVYDPVFSKNCMECHTKENKGLMNFNFDGGDEWTYKTIPQYPLDKYLWRSLARDGYGDEPDGGHRYVPGRFGARESRLGKLMLGSHRKLVSEEDFGRVMLWLDANSIHSSSYRKDSKYPLIEYDPDNKTGVEKHRPLP